MPSFDYFSQLQGPVISTSLFADNYNKGVAAGEAVPSKTTSIIRGIKSGIESGISIVGGIESNILKANEISQLPVENEIRQQQLEQARITGDIAEETKAEKLSATRETLLNTASDLSRKRELREKEEVLQTQLAEADPLTRKKIINSGQFDDVFASNPNVYRQAITPIYPYLSAEERHAADFNMKRSGTTSAYDREAEKRAQLFGNARESVLRDDAISEAARASKTTPEGVAERGRFVASGKYETDDNDNVIIDDKTKQPKISSSYDPSVAPHTYDIIIGDPKTGRSKVAARGATADTRKSVTSYNNEKNWQNGTYKQRALNQVNEEALSSDPSRRTEEAAAVTAPKAEAPAIEQTTVVPNSQAPSKIQSIPVVDSSKNINVGSNPIAINNVGSMLGLPPTYVEEATPKIQEFLKLTEEAPEGMFGRYSGEQVTNKENVINNLSIYTAGKEFELNNKKEAGYDDKAVETHNKMVREVLKNNFQPSSGRVQKDSLPMDFVALGNLSLNDLAVVGSPKDLYILKRKGYFQSQLQKSFQLFKNKIDLTKQALLKAGTRGSKLTEVLNQAG